MNRFSVNATLVIYLFLLNSTNIKILRQYNYNYTQRQSKTNKIQGYTQNCCQSNNNNKNQGKIAS